MITEFEFDEEFNINPIKDLTPEQAWLIFGVTSPEDWDTID